MLILRCTNSVQKLFSLSANDLASDLVEDTLWGSWYVNIFDVGRQKALIFMSEKTLLSFVHVGVKKNECKKENLPFIFYDGLFRLVQMMKLSPSEVSLVMDSHHSWKYAKTNSRSLLGNMNELVSHYQYFLDSDGEMRSDYELHDSMNSILQKNIDYRKPTDVAMSIIRGIAT